MDVASLTRSAGFRVDGARAGDLAGYSVASIGDLNGDGYDDFIIGAPFARPNHRAASGSAYIIFGLSDHDRLSHQSTTAADRSSVLDLAALGTRGIRLDGAAVDDEAGFSVAATSASGDPLGGVIVGAPFASENGDRSSGSVYVLSTAALAALSPGSVIQLATLGDNGFRIDGGAAGDFAGYAVAGAPDLNGDGVPDLIVGAPGASPNGADSGSAFALFDREAGGVLTLAQFTASDGVRLDGAAAGDKAGRAVAAIPASAGGDSPLVVVGAPLANASAGIVYVWPVTPSAGPVELSTASDLRIKAVGAAPGDEAGFSVGAGLESGPAGTSRLLLIGAPGADPSDRSNAGEVYGLDVDHASGVISLAAIPATAGFSLTGSAPGDYTGFSVASSRVPSAIATSGEVALVGAPNAALEGNPLAGVAFLAGVPVAPTTASPSAPPLPRTTASAGDQDQEIHIRSVNLIAQQDQRPLAEMRFFMRHHRLIVLVGCGDEPCNLTARGFLAANAGLPVPPVAPTLRIAEAPVTLSRARHVELIFTRTALRRAGQRLRATGQFIASVTFIAKDVDKSVDQSYPRSASIVVGIRFRESHP